MNRAGQGRLVFPLDDLVKFGLNEGRVMNYLEEGNSEGDPRWSGLVGLEASRARNLIRGGMGGLAGLGDAGARRMGAVVAAQYLGWLDRLERGGLVAEERRLGPFQRLIRLPGAVRLAAAVG